MSFSFSQPCPWALLLVVVSSLLLWENVASVPLSSNETDGYPLSINGLFHNAMRLTWNIKNLNMELRKTYTVNQVSEKLYENYMLDFIEDMEYLVKALTCCHNYSIKTPENLDEAQQIPFNEFPKLILSRMWAWNETSKVLLTTLRSIPGMHDDVISLAKNIETKLAELFEYTQSILNSIYGTTTTGNVEYTVFSGLEDLKSSDEEFSLFDLCKFSYCLRVDIHMVELYLKLLECVVYVSSDVCLSKNIRDAS
ncbi:prolactin-7A2 isoform X1 [Mus musculus]|uniref:prolactin-7A2 isoform X1 n=1 Tax=Mus musculus TaxID=10090 RepID=UPI0003D77461|nr:prolactin-7A2 isoform X1 [Mus musculus]|eukprot:XP_006516644.1 PREDICTED: prolactin-7A2 isoform X1 [Mus musculus]